MDKPRKWIALQRVADTQSSLLHGAAMSRRACEVCSEALGVSLSKTATGTDLGGRRKYSNEYFEDRCGEGFLVNSSRTWVSRSQKTGVFRKRRLCLVY